MIIKSGPENSSKGRGVDGGATCVILQLDNKVGAIPPIFFCRKAGILLAEADGKPNWATTKATVD